MIVNHNPPTFWGMNAAIAIVSKKIHVSKELGECRKWGDFYVIFEAVIHHLTSSKRNSIWWTLTNDSKWQSPNVSTDDCLNNNRFKEEPCQCEITGLCRKWGDFYMMFAAVMRRLTGSKRHDIWLTLTKDDKWQSNKVSANGYCKNIDFRDQTVSRKCWNLQQVGLFFICRQCQS